VNLRVTSQNVSSEMLAISSCIVCWSAFNSKGQLQYTLLFKLPYIKSQVLLGPAKEEAMRHHRKEKSPAVETNGEVQPC
jgi:hypothetical protein